MSLVFHDCDDFDLVKDHAPILEFSNRLRLMKQHFQKVDADIIGLVEIDALMNARCQNDFISLCNVMLELGYANKTYDKNTHMSGIGVFYKKDGLIWSKE